VIRRLFRRGAPVVQSRAGGEIEFTRVVAFSDGVIAIAITLLVLNLDTPDVAAADLPGALGDQWRQYLAFALSFALIGRFWIVHHRAFALIERFDGALMALNLLFLAFIVVMPFATDLVAEYGDAPVAVIVYGAVVGSSSLLTWVMVRHSVRQGHVREELRPLAAQWASWRGLGPTLVFLASVPVAFVSSEAALIVWLLAFLPGIRAGAAPVPKSP
jgi:uncharacterized membrane protein